MSNPYFCTRDQCPACASVAVVLIFIASRLTPEIANYLPSFYGRQGRCGVDYLRGPTMICASVACVAVFFSAKY
ncbi:MAG: hypothetical protein R2911_39350 [Caldilineaceae bacterium]